MKLNLINVLYKKVIVFLVFASISFNLIAQQTNYSVDNYTYSSDSYNLHSFLMGEDVKVKYFAQNAYSRYQSWKSGKDILLVCSGAFSETWEPNSIPVGLTIDNGAIVNKSIDDEMDGLVLIFDEVITALDLDDLKSGIALEDGTEMSFNPRFSQSDRTLIINLAASESYTIFQTQMVYSEDNENNFENLTYGKQRERRFLAICTKDGEYYNLIIDAPNALYLNQSAKNTKIVLEYAGYEVQYILNLDTGDKNICYVNKNSKLVNIGDDDISKATNLIIFYK